jgi:hypothetical protein
LFIKILTSFKNSEERKREKAVILENRRRVGD